MASAALSIRSIGHPVGILNSIEQAFLNSSTASTPKSLSFGVSKARVYVPHVKISPTQILMQDVGLTISDARDRIREFLEGTFNPTKIPELVEYLSERFLRLEVRKTADGSIANYLVDTRTSGRVLASSVDLKLSRPSLVKRFGKSLESEAKNANKIERTPEIIKAEKLRNQSAARLLHGDSEVPFNDWEELVFTAPSMFGGMEFSQQANELWLGVVHATASDDVSENLRILREAKRQNISLIIPGMKKEDILSGRFTPGAPILLRKGAVRSRFVDPRLSVSALKSKFKTSLNDRYVGMNRKFEAMSDGSSMSPFAPAVQVANLDIFHNDFLIPANDIVSDYPDALSRDMVSPDVFTIKHGVDVDGNEEIMLFNTKLNISYPFDLDVVPSGKYFKEDDFGLPAGYIVVDDLGGISHFNLEDSLHNEHGPAVVPPPGSGDEPIYYESGKHVSSDSALTSEVSQPARDVDVEENYDVNPSPEVTLRRRVS